jgi:diacylglycerol kinase family enzyme
VRATKGEHFEIRTHHSHPINTDGELVTFTPARFNLLPKAITVFTPEKKPETAA